MTGRPPRAALAVAWTAVVLVFWYALFVPSMRPGLRRFEDIDLHGYFIPIFWYGNRELVAGRLPLWNPYEYGGLPFVGAMQPAALYPPKVIVYALARHTALHAYMVLHHLLAGVVAFVALSEFGLGWAGASLGTITWVFSAVNMDSQYHPLRLASLTWVPLVLLGFVRILERPGPRPAVLFAVGVSLLILAGYPEYTLDTALCVVLFGLLAGSRLRGHAARSLLWLAAGTALATALAAIQLVPFLEMAAESARVATGGAQTVRLDVFQFVTPALLTRPEQLLGMARLFAQTFHLAPLAWCLALAGTLVARPPLRAPFAGLWLMTVAFASVLLGHLTALPPFSLLRGNHCWIGLSYLPPAYLAGAGLDAVLAPRASARPAWAGLAAALVAPSLALLAGRSWWWLLAGLGLLAAARTRPRLRTPAVLAFLAVVVGSIWTWIPPYMRDPTLPHRYARGEAPYPPEPPEATGLARTLARRCGPGPFRVLAPAASWNGSAVTERIELVQGYPEALAPARMQRLLAEMGLDPSRALSPDWGRVAGSGPLLDLLNVRCVLVPPGERLDAAALGLRRARRLDSGDVLFRRPHAQPRARIAPQTIAVGDGEAAWQELRHPAFDPRRTAVVEGAPPLAASTGGHVSVRSAGAGRLELRAWVPAPATLVVAQTFLPGWHARVDGVEVPLRRADYVLMALTVPGGRHRVTLTYAPPGMRIAEILSAVGVVAAVVLARR